MRVAAGLQRRILAVLEEAGEEEVTTLTNTVTKPQGRLEEIGTMTDALIGLANASLITVAVSRDRTSGHWIPLPSEDVIPLLKELAVSVEWSRIDRIWKWKSHLPRVVVLLTDLGVTAAHQVLSEDGWPEDM